MWFEFLVTMRNRLWSRIWRHVVFKVDTNVLELNVTFISCVQESCSPWRWKELFFPKRRQYFLKYVPSYPRTTKSWILIGKTRNRWEENITAPRVTIHKFLYSVQIVENNIPNRVLKSLFTYKRELVELIR